MTRLRKVIYMAHPVNPTEAEILTQPFETIEVGRGEYDFDIRHLVPHADRVKLAIRANIDRALSWLSWLRRSFPGTTFIAPWIAAIQSGEDDADPAQREAGLVDCCAVVERCDGIVLVGGRISSGMQREAEHGRRHISEIIEVMSGPDMDREPSIRFDVYDLTPNPIDNLIRFPTWSVLTGPSSFDEWYRAVTR